MQRFKNILVAVDLGEDSSWKEALPTAVDQVQLTGGKLHIVTVVPEEPPQLAWLPKDYSTKMIAHANTQLAKLIETQVPEQVRAQPHVRQGTVYSEIVKLANELGIDLIVMASHRPELKDYLLGPNAARVVRHADCPVLVMR
jgi:nucleotide-binding universal stress UspA family protein